MSAPHVDLAAIRARNEARIRGISSDDVDALLKLVAWQQGLLRECNKREFQHHLGCDGGLYRLKSQPQFCEPDKWEVCGTCTCGLDALRKRIEEATK